MGIKCSFAGGAVVTSGMASGSENKIHGFTSKGIDVNKSELIDAIAESAELSKVDAGRALDAVVSAVTRALKSGDSVTLVGFGSFVVKERAARTGRDPRSGKEIQIAASKAPAFKPGKSLKDALN